MTHAESNDKSRVSNTHLTEYSNAHLTDHPSINLVSTTSISVSGNVGNAQIDDTDLHDAMSTDHLNTSAAIVPTTSTLRNTCTNESNLDDTPSAGCSILLKHDMSCTGKSTLQHDPDNIIFPSKGLHICNLNIRQILPRIDDIKILLSHKKCPDIIGLCESFLGKHHPDSLISIDDFDFIPKDRTDVKN